MERCPCCNARLRGRVTCSRCKADLSVLISSEQAAQFHLAQAVRYYLGEQLELCCQSVCLAIGLKSNRLAITIRQFIIQQQCAEILDLMAEKQYILAKQKLYSMRLLSPYSRQLQNLQGFCDYLIVTCLGRV